MIKYHQIPMDHIAQIAEHFVKDVQNTIHSDFPEYIEKDGNNEFIDLVEFFAIEDYKYIEDTVLFKGDFDHKFEEGRQHDGRITVNLCGQNFMNNVASANYENLWDIVYTYVLGIIAHEWCHSLDNETDLVPHSADDEAYLKSPREMNAHVIQQIAINEYGKISLQYCPDRDYIAIDEYWDLMEKLR